MELAPTGFAYSPQSASSIASASVRENSLARLTEKAASLTLGLLITLVFAIAMEKALPQRSHLPTLFHDLRARVTRAFVPGAPALRPSLETVVAHSSSVEAVFGNAEARMSPRGLLVRWRPFIVEASLRFKLPASWILAVMQVESGGRTILNGRPIISRAGALGLMQLLPETYNDMRVRYRLGRDINNPHDNIIAGAAYLRALHRRYGFPSMFAAYNAGPKQFERDVVAGERLPAETRAYIRNVVHLVARASRDLPPSEPYKRTFAAAAQKLKLPA